MVCVIVNSFIVRVKDAAPAAPFTACCKIKNPLPVSVAVSVNVHFSVSFHIVQVLVYSCVVITHELGFCFRNLLSRGNQPRIVGKSETRNRV